MGVSVRENPEYSKYFLQFHHSGAVPRKNNFSLLNHAINLIFKKIHEVLEHLFTTSV